MGWFRVENVQLQESWEVQTNTLAAFCTVERSVSTLSIAIVANLIILSVYC